jgi:hypothetical protein
MAGNSSCGVAETFGFATNRQLLDLLAVSVAKLYCAAFGHGDRFTQWALPTSLVCQIACKVKRQIICKVTCAPVPRALGTQSEEAHDGSEEELTDYQKEEFWKGLGRLYDAAVATQRATEELRMIVESHEKRLDKIEVVVQWLAEADRKRETGG